ncbi:MAG: hypothetical protein ABGY95_00475 [Rubritalea sp.]|uniref:hypothetical protein n=1 Tax=Rubritalea sp. TaxID=2109375 RepID=UPI00324286BE
MRAVTAKSALLLKLAETSALRQDIPADYLLVRSILFDKTADENWPELWHHGLSIAVEEKKHRRWLWALVHEEWGSA